MQQQRKTLGDEFVAAGLITKEQLATALEYQKSLGGSLGQIVVKLGFVPDTKLTSFLGKKFGVPIVDLKTVVLPLELAKRVPWELIQKHQVVPVHVEGRTLTIATADPLDFEAIEELQYATSMQVEYNLSPRSHITGAIKEFAQQLGRGTPSQPAISSKHSRPVSAGTLHSLRETGEQELLDGARSAASARVPTGAINKAELREALIPLLIRKGVITKNELYDAVVDLLEQKGVVDSKELRGGQGR
jgi:hypothetical protein